MSRMGNVHDDNRITDLYSRDPKADTKYVQGKFKKSTQFRTLRPGFIKLSFGFVGIIMMMFGDEILNFIFAENINETIIKYTDWIVLLLVFIGIIGIQQLFKNILDI